MKRSELQTRLESLDYDMYLSLLLHRPMAVSKSHRLIEQWDKRMARKLIGRNFHRPCHSANRVKYWAAAEETDRGHRHYHLLLSFPSDEMKDKFILHLDEMWAQTIKGGTASIDSLGPFDDGDRSRMVNYDLKELPTTESGHIDTSYQTYSKAFSL
jgi:hypothetical protein